MKINHIAFFIILLAFCHVGADAQSSDSRLRMGFKIDKDLSQKLELSCESQVRFKNNWSAFDKFLIEPSVKIEVLKDFRVGTAYRYSSEKNRSRNSLDWHRASLFLSYKHSLATDWDLKMKTALQYDTRSFWGGYDTKYDEWTHRNKISVAYDVFGLPVSTEFGGELFYNASAVKNFEQLRLSLELKYDLSKSSRVELQYLNDFKLQVEGKSNHIWVVMYRIKI